MAYPQIKLDHLSRKRQGYYLHAFYSHMKATGMLFLWVRNYRFWSHYKKGFQGGKSIFCIQKGISYGWGTSTVGIPGFDPLHVAKYGLAWKKIPATLVPFTLTRQTQSGYWWWFSTVSQDCSVGCVRAYGRVRHFIYCFCFIYVRTHEKIVSWMVTGVGACQLLSNFFRFPEVFATVNSTQFPSRT